MRNYKSILAASLFLVGVLFIGSLFSQSRTYRYPDNILPISCPQNQSVTVTVTTTAQIVSAPRVIQSSTYSTGTVTIADPDSRTIEGAGGMTWSTSAAVGDIFRATQDADSIANWYYITSITDNDTLVVDRVVTSADGASKAYVIAKPARVCSYIIHNPDDADDVFFKGIDGGNIGVYSATGASNLNSDTCYFGFDCTRTAPVTGVLLWTAGTTASITVSFKGRDFATP